MLKRYDLPSEKNGEGWAVIVVDTARGFFATVSDFGNYAYLWTAPGCEFRQFLIGLDAYYLQSKLMHGRPDRRVFDAAATKKAILDTCEAAMKGENSSSRTWKKYKYELDLLENGPLTDEEDYDHWTTLTNLEEPWELVCTSPEPQSMAFCEKVMPRFKELLKKELEEEKESGGEEAVHAR